MFAVQPILGHIPTDTDGPPAILNASTLLKNKPFQNTIALRAYFHVLLSVPYSLPHFPTATLGHWFLVLLMDKTFIYDGFRICMY